MLLEASLASLEWECRAVAHAAIVQARGARAGAVFRHHPRSYLTSLPSILSTAFAVSMGVFAMRSTMPYMRKGRI